MGIILRVLLILLFTVPCFAADDIYYLSTTGTKTSGTSTHDDWSNANCYGSLADVLPEMAASDELIIQRGSYTGADNVIYSSGVYPPNGVSDNYTIVKTKTGDEGLVYFDGEDTRQMFQYYGAVAGAMQYVEFHDIVWSNGSGDGAGLLLADSDHVKFFRVGVKDSGGDATDDNEATFSLTRCSYVLAEECYAWGNGRYKFLSYQSDHIVFRRCVARYDWCYLEYTDPKAVYSVYYSDYVEVQNCISIDGDTRSSWDIQTQEYYVTANFYNPNNTNFSENILWKGCMAINTDFPFAGTSGDGSVPEGGPISYTNCVGYDIWDGSLVFNADNTDIKHCTFGAFTHPNWSDGTEEESQYGFNFYNSGTDDEFDDNIIFNVTGITTSHWVINGSQLSSLDNNNFYNLLQSDETIAYANDTNTITSNPATNALLYLTRIEESSTLSGAASDSGDVGATILKKIGVSGKLYDEEGYNTVTEDNLWPWPNEDIIRANMRTYTAHGIDGTRGFCANTVNPRTNTGYTTLTSYIWEYLGNEIPSDIYGVGSSSPTVQGVSFSGTN